MQFTSLTYLYLFFPVTLVLYYVFYRHMAKKGSCLIGNIILTLFSIVFYAAAGVRDVLILLIFVCVIYCLGRLVAWTRTKEAARVGAISTETGVSEETVAKLSGHSASGKTAAKKIRWSPLVLAVSIAAVLYVLVYCKYRPFLWQIGIHLGGAAETKSLLGVSFIVFSAISYLIDIYRGDATPGSPFDAAFYITFFPKVVSGPIVQWKHFQPQIQTRSMDTDRFVAGINRIVIGLAKKVILADTFGTYIGKIAGQTAIDAPSAWLCWLLYALEIYYDFAGYSDIAIGTARLFGFDFKDNFNFPYRSLSVSEFWRRWHISLGTWFKEYIYFPLGGNRKGKGRTLFNLGVVFALTGIWHGAGWAYILWGAIHGFFVIIERVLRDTKFYKAIPAWFKWLFTFLVTASAWELFRFGSVTEAGRWFALMFGAIPYTAITYTWQYYFDARIITLVIIAFLGATLLGDRRIFSFYENNIKKTGYYLLQEVLIIALFVLSMIFIVNSTYSPFIYFQF